MGKVLCAKLVLEQAAVCGNFDRALKRAITKLLDVAEANTSRRITIGLAPEQVSFACSFLYLGFQVAPPRDVPFDDAALWLDFVIDYGGRADLNFMDSHHLSSTSGCSTSAEGDEGLGDFVDYNSDASLEGY